VTTEIFPEGRENCGIPHIPTVLPNWAVWFAPAQFITQLHWTRMTPMDLDSPKITVTSSRSADHKACKGKHMCVRCHQCFFDESALVMHLNTKKHKVSAEKVKEDVKVAKAVYFADPLSSNEEDYLKKKDDVACLKKLGKEAHRRRHRHRRIR
jgi:hypothetical protein